MKIIIETSLTWSTSRAGAAEAEVRSEPRARERAAAAPPCTSRAWWEACSAGQGSRRCCCRLQQAPPAAGGCMTEARARSYSHHEAGGHKEALSTACGQGATGPSYWGTVANTRVTSPAVYTNKSIPTTSLFFIPSLQINLNSIYLSSRQIQFLFISIIEKGTVDVLGGKCHASSVTGAFCL